MRNAEKEIRNRLAASVHKAADRLGPDAKSAAKPIYDELVRDVVPSLVNHVNAEGPFRSRVILGSLTAIVGGGFGLYDLAMSGSREAIEYATYIAALGGGLFALYGRLTTKPAIGAKPSKT